MVTGIILTFFAVSCLASMIVFAACAASGRADQIQHDAFARFYDEADHLAVEGGQRLVNNTQLAWNP